MCSCHIFIVRKMIERLEQSIKFYQNLGDSQWKMAFGDVTMETSQSSKSNIGMSSITYMMLCNVETGVVVNRQLAFPS